MMLFLTLLGLCLVATTKSQFPPQCVTQEALSARRCCPLSEDGTVCGNGTKRGFCQRYQLRKNPPLNDSRCNWPYELYDEICVCNGKHDGANCDDCKPYYHGNDCSTFVPCERPELRQLTTAQRKQFVETLCLAKTTISKTCVVQTGGTMGNVRTYTFQNSSEMDCMVAIHTISAMHVRIGSSLSPMDILHSSSAFCPGHRYLLMQFERMLQRVSGNNSLCLPYWDWTKDNKTCAVCTPDLMGAVNITSGTILPPSCFANWRIACSDATTTSFCRQDPNPMKRPLLFRGKNNIYSWPTNKEVMNCVTLYQEYDSRPYDSTSTHCARACIEGTLMTNTGERGGSHMHNSVHGYVGGCMGSLLLSSNDPMFFCHHAMVDRICAMWEWTTCATADDYPTGDLPPCISANDPVFPSMPPMPMNYYMNGPWVLGYNYSDVTSWPLRECDAPTNTITQSTSTTGSTTTTSSPTTTSRTTTTASTTTYSDVGKFDWVWWK